MKRERLAKGCVAAMAAVCLILSGPRAAFVDAADAIDKDAACSITIQVEGNLVFPDESGTGSAAPGSDLTNQAEADLRAPADDEIGIKLYRVADVRTDVRGGFGYQAVGVFRRNEAFEAALSGVNSETAAGKWREYSEMAAGIVEEAGNTASVCEETVLKGGYAKIEALPIGLYLITAADTYDKDYQRKYSFAPYLISLPDNRYYDAAPGEEGDDRWLYHITVGLKPEMNRMLGDLEIKKTLADTRLLEGEAGATSVFHVVVTNDGEEIYNNMVAFRLGGEKLSDTVTIGKFPAGAVATVTEVYAGAGYEAEGAEKAPSREVTIVSDQAVSADGTASVATADFTNKPDGTLTGGYGVVNHFTEGADTAGEVQKESSADVENKTVYGEALSDGDVGADSDTGDSGENAGTDDYADAQPQSSDR